MTAYNDIGFSDIRLPDTRGYTYLYTYNPSIMTFPQEVFVHEFLHSLERNMNENGYTIPALHDNEQYGYAVEPKIGLENWYRSYMMQKIYDKPAGKYIGLYPAVYSMKPPQKSEFQFPIEAAFNQEPKNVLDDI
ncbi:MAG: hypothetical protein FWC53_00730, partial [Firmicutes bacterium]|nr:hypothetical protein [Bacillota bacterium]